MIFNIILICLYDIDVGTIPWRSLESRGILDLWEFKKASLSAIKLQLFKITSFWIVKKHFIGLSPPFIVDHTFDCNYHCIPTYYRNFKDIIGFSESENTVHLVTWKFLRVAPYIEGLSLNSPIFTIFGIECLELKIWDLNFDFSYGWSNPIYNVG